jgi:hypothetical protein
MASHKMIKQLIPPIAMWIATKVLDAPKVKGALTEADSYAYIGKRRASRAVKKISKNAASRPAWVAASAAAFVLGISFMAKASSKKR